MDTFTWRFVSHANRSKRKLEFLEFVFFIHRFGYFFQSLKWHLARGVVKRNNNKKKNHSLYVTLKARAKRKGKSVVQQVSNLVCFFSFWMSDHSLSMCLFCLQISVITYFIIQYLSIYFVRICIQIVISIQYSENAFVGKCRKNILILFDQRL